MTAAFLTTLVAFAACGDDTQSPVALLGTPVDAAEELDGSRCRDDADCSGADASGTEAVCGDGVVGSGEGCDDGNLVAGDGCNPICQIEACGNGVLDSNEDCEPPRVDGCSETCQSVLVRCGNGVVETELGEQCDDGNAMKGDGCHRCRFECGDGILDRDVGEECEPVYTPRDSTGQSLTCTAQCRLRPYCGDGRLQADRGEECDPPDGVTCVDDCRLARGQAPRACSPGSGGGPGERPRENLVPNGDFRSDLTGWAVGLGVEAVHTSDQGHPMPGAVRLTVRANASGPALRFDGLYRCLVVRGGESYEFEAHYLNPPRQASQARAFAVVLVYPNTSCSGEPAPVVSAVSPTVETAGSWRRYAVQVDAGAIADRGQTVSILVKLGAIVPAGGSAVAYWDSASLRAGAFLPGCGNCELDPGEECDDGNTRSGDGCSAACRNELRGACGNLRIDPGESCDTGVASFRAPGDCTPLCTRKDECLACAALECPLAFDACLDMTGVAQAGLGAGLPRAQLCGRLRECVARSGCAEATMAASRRFLGQERAPSQAVPRLEHCYCGNAELACLLPGTANGSCQREIEALLETSDPAQVLARMDGSDPRYPGFSALAELRACERERCRGRCGTELRCGNGVVQDRPESFKTFRINVGGSLELCEDRRTPSGRGCTFEECDGGPLCDESCFVLECGNGLLQTGERCDDGNRVAGDGCSPTCQPEFECGDGVVASAFGEECDPPNSGPLCSLADFMLAPARCGCGADCRYSVCGNQVRQAGEDCDPPDGVTCDANCKAIGANPCVTCMLLAGDVDGYLFATMLAGSREYPGVERGCRDIPECLTLLNCLVSESSCWAGVSPASCFCGSGPQDVDRCESPGFTAVGQCKAQFLAAFAVQYGRPPADNAEVLDAYFGVEQSPGRLNPLGLATLLAGSAFDEIEAGLRAAMAAGAPITEEQVVSCRPRGPSCFPSR
ncbi:MAG: DUF4215 domain-containing protein [Armatimonadota bacterium]|nr:DUF4215 domain-containing protein [Armatimonadota bacterium]